MPRHKLPSINIDISTRSKTAQSDTPKPPLQQTAKAFEITPNKIEVVASPGTYHHREQRNSKRPAIHTLSTNESRLKRSDQKHNNLLVKKCEALTNTRAWAAQVLDKLKITFLENKSRRISNSSLDSRSDDMADPRVLSNANFTSRRPRLSLQQQGEGPARPSTEATKLIRETLEDMETSDVKMRRTSRNAIARRARHSAPDLTFGGRINLEKMQGYGEESLPITQPPLERRSSLGSDLELIEEETSEQTITEAESSDLEPSLSQEHLQMSPMRLPPIFENQGFKLTRRDFSPADANSNNNSKLRIRDAAKYRYVRNRKLSM